MSLAYQTILNEYVTGLIWNKSSDAIFALDYHGAVVDANPSFNNMLGWETEELEGIAFPPFIVDMSNMEHQRFLKQLEDGQNFPYEIVKRRDKYGEILDVLASYWPVNDENILAIGMYKDFTEQMNIQRKLEESEYCYRTLVEHLPEAIVKQRANNIEFVNSAALQFLGVSSLKEMRQSSIWDFVFSERKNEIQFAIDTIYDENSNNKSTTIIVDKFVRQDGEEIWAEVKVIPIGNKAEPDIQIVFRDVTAKKRYEAQLESLAYHDPLTGLKNRRRFTELVTESIELAKQSLEQVAIMYLDMDHFKTINDTYGHDAGDQLLQEFAKRLENSVRKTDTLCRVGGDEFLVLLEGFKKKEDIEKVGKKLLSVLREPYEINGLTFQVTTSIGIAVLPENANDCQTLIQRADKALYRAKEQRNNLKFDE